MITLTDNPHKLHTNPAAQTAENYKSQEMFAPNKKPLHHMLVFQCFSFTKEVKENQEFLKLVKLSKN